MSQQRAMDRMYRLQRHFYDATRKYYLLGRDTLLQRMDLKPGDRVLEIACGTARNLLKLSSLRPGVKLYGLDASEEMLKTATAKLACTGQDVPLRVCLAEELDYRATFGLEAPFDAMFFSYGLSMIPTWPDALAAALRNLKPGGTLYIVDFWDQSELPRWFRFLLVRWLALFHVVHRPELLAHLREEAARGRFELQIESVGRRYAYIATLTTPQSAPAGVSPAPAAQVPQTAEVG